ncbi:MAG: tetratricopeptide repeat protein [Candidatus Brocadiae bacterium]|nr:tetratricopeptide repeat protein [Candidatus Brocadiia bacterium]
MRPRLAVALSAILASAATACIWDSDTIRDEMQTRADDFDLIVGQFPHHGAGYHESRVAVSRAALEKDPKDIAALNDLGVALLKLGRWDESEAAFASIEALQPGKYETFSNLGVMYKKKGDFAKAAEYTKKALAIRPSGHLGLGDYYLKMLDWRSARAADPKAIPGKDFLGREYSQWSMWSRPLQTAEDRERLCALVRSDRLFPDALLVLGDQYCGERNLNLAMWAWVRALDLGHPNPNAIETRMAEVFRHWKEALQHRGGRTLEVKSVDAYRSLVSAALKKATGWQESFETIEGELVAKNPGVDFATVEAEMVKRGQNRYRPENLGLDGAGSGKDDRKQPDEAGAKSPPVGDALSDEVDTVREKK